jgi:hypothetical protein
MLKTIKPSAAFIVFTVSIAAVYSVTAQETERDRLDEYIVTLPEGTIVPIVLSAYLNTKNSQEGDTIYATTVYPIWQQQKLVIPKGSEIRGTVMEVVRPGRIKGKGRLGPGEETIDRKSESVDGGATKGEDAGTVAVMTGQGASLGTLVGGLGSGRYGTGAAIGAGAGAAAGIATILLTRGKDLVIEPGTQFDLELLEPLEFSYYELEFSRSQLNDAQQSVNPPPRPMPAEGSGRSIGLPRVLPGIGFPY